MDRHEEEQRLFPSEKPSQIKFPSPKMHALRFCCVHILGRLWFIRKSSASAVQPQEGARNIRRLHSLTADTFGVAFREAKRRKWGSSLLCIGALAGSEGRKLFSKMRVSDVHQLPWGWSALQQILRNDTSEWERTPTQNSPASHTSF